MSPRFLAVTSCLLAVLVASASAESATPKEALDQDAAFEFSEVPLDVAMKLVGDLHKVTIEIDKAGLQRAGVAADHRLTAAVKDKKLSAALAGILKPLKLTHKIVGEKIVITDK